MEQSFECFPQALPGSDNGIWLGGNPLNFSLPLLSLQLFLVFSVTRLVSFLLRPLKQPRVVSEIIGGIILGPSLLCRNEAFRKTIFPDRGTPLLETVATFGLMYVTFLIGVKMDPGLLKRSGKKAAVIGLSGIAVPFTLINLVLHLCVKVRGSGGRNNKDREIMMDIFDFAFSASLSTTSFAVLVPMLSELRLLNSEIGRIAMSASMTNDGIVWLIISLFIVIEAKSVSTVAPLWAFLSILALLVIIVCVVRPVALWVIAETPPGKPVEEGYIFFFLFAVLVVGFFSDIVGMSFFHGALILGLAIPDGPPLGAALAEKIESIVSGLLLPLYYALTGFNTNIYDDSDDNQLYMGKVLLLVFFMGWLGKLAGVVGPSLYFRIPLRDALSLGLFMSCKGIFEIITYHYWLANGIVKGQVYVVLVLCSTVVTAISTPLAATIYDPQRKYTTYKKRTVEHHKQEEELRILACVSDQSQVPPAINILEAVSTSCISPITLYVLHLLELKGRDAPLLIQHDNKLVRSTSLSHHASQSSHIVNAFLVQERRHPSLVSVQPFTTISPYASMHDEVCQLALEKRASLILLPFHKNHYIATVNPRLRAMNQRVLANAPCSVALIVDRLGPSASVATDPAATDREFHYNVLLFFFGGEHDREGLAIASRMVHHQGVNVSVLRFLPSRSIKDNQAERKLDGRMLDQFRYNNAGNDRVVYREVLVKDMEEVMEVIRAATEEAHYDLLIVGARHRVNSVVSEGEMVEWSECPELGVVGDLLASPDFGQGYAILVVLQQNLSGSDSQIQTAGSAEDNNAMTADATAWMQEASAAGRGGSGSEVGLRPHGSTPSISDASVAL